MSNITDQHVYNATDWINDEGKETGPAVVVIVVQLCCAWIILINGAVFACLVIHRRAMKTFVNLQLLSFSITDILVGISAILGSLTYHNITTNIWICSVITYMYLVAQAATLFHAFGICLHRFITVKYRHLHRKKENKGRLKRIMIHVIAIWLLSIVLVAIPFACFARFDQSLNECSANGIFGDNYIKFIAVYNTGMLLPQVGMNILYICLFRYLFAKWSFKARTKTTKQGVMLLTFGRFNTTVQQSSRQNVNSTDNQRLNETGTIGGTMSQGVEENLRINSGEDKQNIASGFVEDQTNACDDISKCGLSHKKLSSSHKDLFNEPQSNCETDMDETKQTKNDAIASVNPSDAKYDVSNSINIPMNSEQYHQSERGTCTRKNRETDNQNASSYSSGTNISRQITAPDGRKPLSIQMEKEVICTIGILLLLLNICITPLNLLLVIELNLDDFLSRKVKFIILSFALINSGLNPFVYAFKLKPFREILKCHKDRCVAFCRK